MRLHRFYHPPAHGGELQAGITLELSDNARQHACKVLRLKSGDEIQLFDGQGTIANAAITACEKRCLQAQVREQLVDNSLASIRIHLYQAISRGQKMDYTLQKATELGVTSITPVYSQRSRLQIRENKLEHWRNVLISACEQSGNNTLPLLHEPLTLEQLAGQPPGGAKILLSPLSATPLGTHQSATHEYHLLCGPEGGFSEADERHARDAGFQGCLLGKRILRTETASIAAISALHALFGDFSG